MKQKHFQKCLFSQAIRRISWGLKKEFELAKVNEPSEFELLKFDCSMLLFLNVKGTPHLQKRVFLTRYELLLNGVEVTVKRKPPAWVAQLDAHPTGDQEVAGSTPALSATFFHGDWS